MSPSAWIALASFASFLFVQTAVACLAIGGLFARLNALERTPRDDCKAEMAAVNATLVAMQKTLEGVEERTAKRFEDLEHTVRNYVMGSQPTRRRSTTQG